MQWDLHAIFDIISSVAALAWLVLGLAVKNKILDLKIDIEKGDARSSENHAKIEGLLDGHLEQDKIQFRGVNQRLDRIERRLDHI